MTSHFDTLMGVYHGKLLSANDENWDYCDECGEPVCNDCGTAKDDERFCSECLEKGEG